MVLKSKENKILIDKIMKEFSHTTGHASVLVDIQGSEVTQLHNFTTFCQKMRTNPKTRALCQKCDLFGGLEATKLVDSPHIYRCHAGLIDFSVPIIINDQLVAFFTSGQLITENENDFESIHPFQTDWQHDAELVKAYQSLPVRTSEEIAASAEILRIISNYYLKRKLETEIEKKPTLLTPKLKGKETKTFEKNKEIEKSLKYIEKNLNKSLTLEEVASHVHLSSFYFSKLFKKETGKNFIHYINDEKMELAQSMLINTSLPIDVISSNLGFSHTSYFCKIFKKKFGTTPKNYRKTFSLKAN